MPTNNLTTEQRHEMVLAHMTLAERIATSKYRKLTFLDLEELKSAAYMGLVDAASKYDSGQCDCFAAYACLRVSGAIRDYLRELGWGSRTRPLRRSELLDDREVAPSEEKSKGSNDLFDLICCELPEANRRVLKRHYLDGWKVREIAEEMGLQRSRISQILSSARSLVRERWLGRESELWSEVA